MSNTLTEEKRKKRENAFIEKNIIIHKICLNMNFARVKDDIEYMIVDVYVINGRVRIKRKY